YIFLSIFWQDLELDILLIFFFVLILLLFYNILSIFLLLFVFWCYILDIFYESDDLLDHYGKVLPYNFLFYSGVQPRGCILLIPFSFYVHYILLVNKIVRASCR